VIAGQAFSAGRRGSGDFAAAEAEYMGSPERAATLVGAPQVMRGAKIGRATRVM
jgi:hypothetical protein